MSSPIKAHLDESTRAKPDIADAADYRWKQHPRCANPLLNGN